MIKDFVNTLFILNGVIAVTFFKEDGQVVEELDKGDLSDQQLTTSLSFMMAESRAMALKIGNEPFTMVYVEFQDRILLSAPIKEQFFVVVVAKPTANIAQISSIIKKHQKTITTDYD
jgi:predicted regulator of Ras-like GTPase activity (Roadblock/LC7/MglB family)